MHYIIMARPVKQSTRIHYCAVVRGSSGRGATLWGTFSSNAHLMEIKGELNTNGQTSGEGWNVWRNLLLKPSSSCT